MESTAAGAAGAARGKWTPKDIGDLTGVTAIITGANSGLGLRTAVRLAEHGATVVLACRDTARGAAALATVRAQAGPATPAASGAQAPADRGQAESTGQGHTESTGQGHAESADRGQAELAELDLADLASVRRFAAAWGDRRLDLLINNAGVMAIPRRLSADGFELQLATNHLGHFALTGLLLPALLAGRVAGGAARVVTLSSALHRSGRMQGDDLMLEHNYTPWRAYGQSKLANLLFMGELRRRVDAVGVRLDSLAAHPGYAATNLQAVGPTMSGNRVSGALMRVANLVVAQSADTGAWPTLRAASDPGARSGEYYGPRGLGEQRGAPRRVGMSSQALDPVAAGWLWERSVELTGVDYARLWPSP